MLIRFHYRGGTLRFPSIRRGMRFLNPEVTKGTVDASENLHLVEVGGFSRYLRDLIWFYTSQVLQDIFDYPPM